MSRLVEITKSNGSYTVDPNASAGSPTLYVYGAGGESVALPVSSGSDVTVGMRGLGCRSGSECMILVECIAVSDHEMTFVGSIGEWSDPTSDPEYTISIYDTYKDYPEGTFSY